MTITKLRELYKEETGNVSIRTIYEYSDWLESKITTCPICKGKGEVRVTDVDYDPCRRCDGSGILFNVIKKI